MGGKVEVGREDGTEGEGRGLIMGEKREGRLWIKVRTHTTEARLMSRVPGKGEELYGARFLYEVHMKKIPTKDKINNINMVLHSACLSSLSHLSHMTNAHQRPSSSCGTEE